MNQTPMTAIRRLQVYSRQRRGYYLPAGTITPRQRRRIDHKANRDRLRNPILEQTARPATARERCTCGRPAIKVHVNTPRGDIAHCGRHDHSSAAAADFVQAPSVGAR